MKKIRQNIIALSLLATLASCGNFLDINNNPNAPAVTVPDPVLAGALVETARSMTQDVSPFAAPWAGYWSFSGTYSSAGAVGENYKLQNANYQNVWNNTYLNLSNYNLVEKAGATKGYEYYKGIAMIMKAYDFHTLVDCYNDIPYSKALLGFQNLNPTYDDGASVYTDLIAKLGEAVAVIKAAQAVTTTKVVPPTADVMFKGNMDQWIHLANTMRLKLLVRLSQKGSAADIAAAITDITTNGAASDGNLFLGAGEDAQINPGYQKANGLQNPLWEFSGLGVGNDVGGRDYFRDSDYSLQFFKNNNDARLDYIFRLPGKDPGTTLASLNLSTWSNTAAYTVGTLVLYNNGGSTKVYKCIKAYTGVGAAQTTPDLDATDWTFGYFAIPWGTPPTTNLVSGVTSGFGSGVMGGPGSPVTFLSAAESMFLQAEATQRGWLTASTAQTLFQNGIKESFRLLGVPNYATAAAAYYSNGKTNCDWTASANKIQAIIVQKWAANHTIDNMEAYSDWRRTGYPNDLPNSLDPLRVGPGTPPVRLLYPQTEYNVNAGAVSGYTIDIFNSKIFWMP